MNVIITGTSQGIGLELVKTLAQLPFTRILALSRNLTPLEPLLTNDRIQSFRLDLLNPGSMDDLTRKIDSFFNGSVNVLVNNAGVLVRKAFEEYTPNDFDRMFGVNVKGVYLLTSKLLPYFTKPAHIVNISSMAGFQGSQKFEGLSLYAASKGALTVLTECLAMELQPRQIHVNALALGAVDTPMLQQAFPGHPAGINPKDMAEFIAAFALNGYKTFNGKILPVAVSTA
ncbi:MAG: SDR family oxidoreductase [Bacteroidota bacterium]